MAEESTNIDTPGLGKSVSILGVPLSYGQSKGGVHLGPAAMRVASIAQRISSLGYEVNDRGDLPIERSHTLPGFDEKLKYVTEIYDACERLSAEVERMVDAGERELIRRLGIRFFTMRDIDERGLATCLDEAIGIAAQGSGGYSVTFDVDVLDPGDAPGSGTLVRGGLSYREAHLAMEKIAEAGGMQSLEVVEINTALDVNNRTAELGVQVILPALGNGIP